MEAMGFDKSGWVIVETSADGNTTYMGKPMTPDAKPDEPIWSIKRIVTNEKGGINATKLVVKALELGIINLEHLEEDDE